jgi:hypothetical protein
MMLSRRTLLTGVIVSPAILAPGLIAGCQNLSGSSATQVAAQVVSDVGTIAAGLAGALPALGATGAVPAALVAKVGGWVATIQQVAGQVVNGMPQASAQPLVKQIEGLVNDIVMALAGVPLPPPFGPALAAAAVLLPVIETAIGLAVPGAARMTAAAMSPDEARLILRGAAAGK